MTETAMVTAPGPASRSQEPESARRLAGQLWVRRGCALVVAAVAAYSSYAHQRQFALDGGADTVSAALWPLSVGGLVILASTGLLAQRGTAGWRARWAVRAAFLLGVAVSLAANIAAAPSLTWQPIVVAGWPPLALLLAVELVMHARHRDHSEHRSHRGENTHETGRELSPPGGGDEGPSAEERMWAYFEQEVARGRIPTGVELDRIAGTSTYGRKVLARWRRSGRIPAAGEAPHPDRQASSGTNGTALTEPEHRN